MIINLTQMRIWEMNPHLPKPTPSTLPARSPCAGSCPALVPGCRWARMGKRALLTGMPPAHPCGRGTASPWQCPQALPHQKTPRVQEEASSTLTCLVFMALQHRENYPPAAAGKASRCPRQPAWARSRCPPSPAELLVSGPQAAWSSTAADSTTGPWGAAEKDAAPAPLQAAVGSGAGNCWWLFSWHSQQEGQGGPAHTRGRINQQTQVDYLALRINTSVGYMCRGTKL